MRLVEYLDKRLIDGWRTEWKRLHTIKLTALSAVFWIVIEGLNSVWPALAGNIPVWIYALVGFVLSVLIGLGRYLKQTPAEGE